jgi:hypothetical protein
MQSNRISAEFFNPCKQVASSNREGLTSIRNNSYMCSMHLITGLQQSSRSETELRLTL